MWAWRHGGFSQPEGSLFFETPRTSTVQPLADDFDERFELFLPLGDFLVAPVEAVSARTGGGSSGGEKSGRSARRSRRGAAP